MTNSDGFESSDEFVPMAEVASSLSADSKSFESSSPLEPFGDEGVFVAEVVGPYDALKPQVPLATVIAGPSKALPSGPIRRGSPFQDALKHQLGKTAEQRFAARGAALGSIVIGTWGLAGSLFPLDMLVRMAIFLSAFLGLSLALWGLAGIAKRQAIVGATFNLLAAFASVIGLALSQWR